MMKEQETTDVLVMPFKRPIENWPDDWFEKDVTLKLSDVLVLLDAMECSDGDGDDETVNRMIAHYAIGYETHWLAVYKKLLCIALENGCKE